ncbi:hypothetical protein K5V21_05790 [Clostridium sardiniense]|uniref:Uncharacterized protein n=1 Tax=Clostridium sardiniense TaxID=29369 RepID=A0ABS7KVX4_CLOSR|nr:hypothetical protein [Clostridium sardiniense]MBM7834184.1 hypothetical protein [Clostridium sardiniense]MBY0754964.1 hypothetical protein [Clostridium sardiniense]MDQ0459182.1 hypothetical protein [Clostridium sardiniense]
MATIKIFNKKIQWDGLNLTCVMERYLDTNNIALEVYDEYGEFYEGITLDYKETLPKSNNAIINNRNECEGILSVLTGANIAKVVGKIDVNLLMRDLVVVNSREFKEIDEDLFLDFAKSSFMDLNSFIADMSKAEEEVAVDETAE